MAMAAAKLAMGGNQCMSIAQEQKIPLAVRIVAMLSSIIVFGCISNQAQVTVLGTTYCYYGLQPGPPLSNSPSICGFGIFVGVMSWLFEIVLTVLLFKAALPCIANVQLPPRWPLIQLIFGAVWDVFLFANAINLSAGYSSGCPGCPSDSHSSGALGAVFFSYMSLGCWAWFTIEFYRLWREGSPKGGAKPQTQARQAGNAGPSIAQPPMTSAGADPALEGNTA